MPEQLKVVIDADVNGAIAGVNKFARSVDGLTTGSIAQLRKASQQLKIQLENLSPSALKSSFGKQLSDALKLVETNLKSLEKQSGVTSERFEDVFRRLERQVNDFATLIPAVAIGTAIGAASSAFEDFIKKLFSGKQALTEFQKANSEAIGKSGEESIKLEGLVSIARDVTLSTKERKAAIDQLQESYPAYLKNISLENINSAAAKKSIDALTEAIFNKALADQFAGLAAKKNIEIFEKIQKIQSLAKLAAEADNQTSERLARSGLKLENERLNKLLEERDKFKQAFKDAQVDFFDVFKPDDTKKLKELAAKLKKEQDEIIARARLFVKEFGDSFVLPDLSDKFFTKKDELLKSAKNVLDNVKAFIGGDQSALKIKIPIIATTETKVNADDLKKFLRGEISESDIRTIKIRVPIITDADFKIAEDLAQEFKLSKDELEKQVDGFMKSFVPKEFQPLEIGIPVDLTVPTKVQADQLDKLLEGFSKLGTIGFKAFEKIDFKNFNEGLKEGNATLERMLALANTLAQSIGNGLSNAFDSVFDAVLQGKSVFKALGQAVQSLVVETIKAIVKMLILRAVTAAIFPGAGNAAGTGGLGKLIGGIARGGQANLGFGSIGSLPFQNVLTVNVNGQISGDVIRLAGQRAANSAGRFG